MTFYLNQTLSPSERGQTEKKTKETETISCETLSMKQTTTTEYTTQCVVYSVEYTIGYIKKDRQHSMPFMQMLCCNVTNVCSTDGNIRQQL